MQPQLIDTHGHVSFSAFDKDYREVIANALDQNIWMISPGTQKDTSSHAVKVANEFETGVYAAVGLHPLHLIEQKLDQEEIHFQTRAESFDPPYYEKLASDPKCIAIGECGLEYFRIQEHANNAGINLETIKDKQHETYFQHLELAKKINKPIINHCRPSSGEASDAYDDMLELAKNFPDVPGVMHCFLGSYDTAKTILDRGWYISFTGIITFAKQEYLLDAVRQIPLEKILIETDAPYLSPVPFRGKRNLPNYVEFIARRIAELKKISFETVAEQTTKNARELFRI